ncbi:adrenocorticotropic hormone receptor-like [Amphibalanus amphitrite]|uniref:adrenocorticotropic hormone receptor-like n=1 Tax=Amphibalanus amphitrite TaxID=1232801 RepID=UPI001C91D9C6|nr:adrenocorticotropic hormone receptor-like [Amphibalanus amphitrite]
MTSAVLTTVPTITPLVLHEVTSPILPNTTSALFPNTTAPPSSSNDTEAPASREELERRLIYLIWIPVMLLLCAVASLTNLAICLSARLVRRPLSPTLCFSVSLAGADAFAALLLGIGLLVNSLLPQVLSVSHVWDYCWALAFEALRLGGIISTAAHLLALAMNHYIGILRPLHYNRLVTRGRVLLTLPGLWLAPVVFFLAYFATVDAFASCDAPPAFIGYHTFREVVAVLFFVPLACMVVAYTHIFIIVRQHQTGALRNHNTSQLRKNVKAVVTTLLILGTYVFGWMPAVLTFALFCVDCAAGPAPLGRRAHLALNILVNTLIILKCLVNPIIYALRMPEIRLALRRLRSTTTSTSRLSTLRQNGETAIPLRTLAATNARRPSADVGLDRD